MTRSKYLLLAGIMVFIYLISAVTDLDLGGFGWGLLIIAAVFGLLAVATPTAKGDDNG